MKNVGFPALEAHAGLHEALLREAHQLRDQVASGDALDVTVISHTLHVWLIRHIVQEDAKLGAFVFAAHR